MTSQAGSANMRTSQSSLQSGQTLSFAKTLQVQDQIIEQLRADQTALREALDIERTALKDCRITSDREMKVLQRENIQLNKINKQMETKLEDMEKELNFVKESLAFEQQNLKALEKEHANTLKDMQFRTSKDVEKTNKQELIIDQLKSEIEDLKASLQSERNATNLLIREHNAEVKMLREEVRHKSTEAYRELKERAAREREEYREIQEEADKMCKVMEKDFRNVLAEKEEELRRVRAEAKVIQKDLEDQLRASLREPSTPTTLQPPSNKDYVEIAKFRRLKNEVNVLKEQNRKLLNEMQLLTEDPRVNELSGSENFIIPYVESKLGKPNLNSQSKKSMSVLQEKCSEVEITRMASDFSIGKNDNIKRQFKSSFSIRRDDGFRPYPKTKTEEHYEELKRTMQILRKALQ